MFSTLVRWNELIASRKMVILLLSFIDSSAAIVKHNCPKPDSRLWNKVNPCDCPYNIPTFACGTWQICTEISSIELMVIYFEIKEGHADFSRKLVTS